MLRCLIVITDTPEGQRMNSTIRLALFIATLISMVACTATEATDSDFKALIGKVLVGRCHMDVCWWFSIENSEHIGDSKKGELFKFSVKDWESNHPNCTYSIIRDRKLTGTTDVYAFCSRTNPAIVSHSDTNAWSASLVFPDRNDTIFGVNEGVYRIYWAMCHGISLDDIYETGARLATQLGYHTNSPGDDAANMDRPVAQPEDVLLW
jgi:hypothetical protein